jgi:hypothetical protein
MNITLKTGDVFKSKHVSLLRVLIVDSICFLFEEHDITGWNKSNKLTKHLTFYLDGIKPFLAYHPTFIRNEPFTKEETDIIRPDLPLSIGRTSKCNWKDVHSMSQNDFESLFSPKSGESFLCEKIYIYPKGPKGGMLKAVPIMPDNKNSFTLKEILQKAASIQIESNPNILGGMGLFRAGVKSKYPTYMIDDYYKGEFQVYKLEEEGFDWEKYFKSWEHT